MERAGERDRDREVEVAVVVVCELRAWCGTTDLLVSSAVAGSHSAVCAEQRHRSVEQRALRRRSRARSDGERDRRALHSHATRAAATKLITAATIVSA